MGAAELPLENVGLCRGGGGFLRASLGPKRAPGTTRDTLNLSGGCAPRAGREGPVLGLARAASSRPLPTPEQAAPPGFPGGISSRRAGQDEGGKGSSVL